MVRSRAAHAAFGVSPANPITTIVSLLRPHAAHWLGAASIMVDGIGVGDGVAEHSADAGLPDAASARHISVKAKYQLWVTSAERDAMARVLEACPGQLPPR